MEQLSRLPLNPADDSGQTMAEYVLILAGVFLAVASVLALLSDPVNGLFSRILDIYQ